MRGAGLHVSAMKKHYRGISMEAAPFGDNAESLAGSVGAANGGSTCHEKRLTELICTLALSTASLLQVLGFGDFYYELGVQIVEACLATRPLNGGLMEMKPLMRFVNVSCGFLLAAHLQPNSPLQAINA